MIPYSYLLSCISSRLPPGRRGLKLTPLVLIRGVRTSPSPRKAWIETVATFEVGDPTGRRLPPGRRGLKRWVWDYAARRWQSPSPRKAWIETSRRLMYSSSDSGRLPPGRRGLKLDKNMTTEARLCRLPPGRRGLKRLGCRHRRLDAVSPSPRKAWIETKGDRQHPDRLGGRLPPEGVD